jgi:hypothetical protein
LRALVSRVSYSIPAADRCVYSARLLGNFILQFSFQNENKYTILRLETRNIIYLYHYDKKNNSIAGRSRFW